MIKRGAVLVLTGLGLFGVAAGATYLVSAATVSTTTVDGLRDTAYSSLEQLAAASSVVVSAQVVESGSRVISDETGRSGPPFVVSTVKVTEVLAIPEAGRADDGVPKAGDLIDVFQLGLPGSLFGGGEVLRSDGTYVLFLRATSMSGSTAADFIPTGTFSGIYALDADGTISQKPAEGDTLPARASFEELRQALR